MGRDPVDELGEGGSLDDYANEWSVEAPRMTKMRKRRLRKWAFGDPWNARPTKADAAVKSIERRRISVTLPKITLDDND